MKYCSKCLMPDTKPYIRFDDSGVCNACLAHIQKREYLEGIDWKQRQQEFEEIVLERKSQKAPFYDAMVPVSGGKDSITQIHRLLKYGLRILAVNVDYGIKTEIGRSNLNLIPQMGANLITYRPALPLHKKLIRIGFEDFGDPDLLSHTMLHGCPLRLALKFQIPLALLGENSAFEYGGDEKIANQSGISRQWFDRYAANAGRDAGFVSKKYDIAMNELMLYDYPDELDDSDTKTVFLSYYYPWDSEKHLEIAKGYGFKSLSQASEGTFRNFVGIDEKINRIHQYMKVLKFGYGRATDHACEEIRNERLSRNEAIKLVKEYDVQPLSDYFVDDFCEFLGYSKDEFWLIMEKYCNKVICHKGENGELHICGHEAFAEVTK